MKTVLRNALALASFLILLNACAAPAPVPIEGPLQGPFTVEYVYDGDTLEIAGEKVRLLSIDAPESSWNPRTDSEAEIALGRQAKELTRQLIEGKDVYLELGIEERDRYGRVLAWVYWPDPDGLFEKDGRRFTMLNYELVRQGWANAFVLPPNVRYAKLFTQAARQARELGLGMWAALAAEVATVDAPLRILCVIYNPPGPDEGHEAFILEASRRLSLEGYAVGDDEGFRYPLTGSVSPGRFTVVLKGLRPELSNKGDVALLLYRGQVVDRFQYEGRRGQSKACR